MGKFETAIYGEKDGSHQLLESSFSEKLELLEDVRFAVDRPIGHLEPGVKWFPYWGCGPVRGWWTVWRGVEDSDASRLNMVRVKVAFIGEKALGDFQSMDDVLNFLGASEPKSHEIEAAVASSLVAANFPLIIPSLNAAPRLLRGLWPKLWPAARFAFSLRTMFGRESLHDSTAHWVIVTPSEMIPRWTGTNLLDVASEEVSHCAGWLSGEAYMYGSLVSLNINTLPGDPKVLSKLERIANCADSLATGDNRVTAALTIIRTVESLDFQMALPSELADSLSVALSNFSTAGVSDVRAASLTTMSLLKESSNVLLAISKWIEAELSEATTKDATWILQAQFEQHHSKWWREAVQRGLRTALSKMNSKWAEAVWRWWQEEPLAVTWLSESLPVSLKTEDGLLEFAPTIVSENLRPSLQAVFGKRKWSRLLAQLLQTVPDLGAAVKVLVKYSCVSDKSLSILLKGRNQDDVCRAAVETGISEMMERAAKFTQKDPTIFQRIPKGKRSYHLLTVHFKSKGSVPPSCESREFLSGLVDEATKGARGSLELCAYLTVQICRATDDFRKLEPLVGDLPASQSQALRCQAVEEWLNRLRGGETTTAPADFMLDQLKTEAPLVLSGCRIQLILKLLDVIPRFSEELFVAWLEDHGFAWTSNDHEHVAAFLIERKWVDAVRRFRSSWKRELQIVAWHARSLCSFFDNIFWTRPRSLESEGANKDVGRKENSMTIESTNVHVGIITMKEEEQHALLEVFSTNHHLAGQRRDYDCIELDTTKGKCFVAITRSLQQGNIGATVTAQEMLGDIDPDFILVVGIAGGVPCIEFCLGDVVVSNYIQDLTLEDTGATGESSRYNALGGPLDPRVTRIVERLQSIDRDGLWAKNLAQKKPKAPFRPATDETEWNKKIKIALKAGRERANPKATAQKIASSDRLIKDPDLLKDWQKILKAVAAVEMESAGAYSVCQRHSKPILSIRGISDIIGLKRDEEWTVYACITAATYTRMLVENGVFVS